MISKAQIKSIRLLHQKKYRDQEGLFIAEGPKIFKDLLASGFTLKDAFATKEFKADTTALDIHEISDKELESISALTNPNQILATFEIANITPNIKDLQQKLVLGLDDIRDPGNLGTIIRIADWFGISDILCSRECVDVYNPKVIQATMGSIARVNVLYVDMDEILKEFKTIYAAVLDGVSIYTEKLSPPGILLIGNESNGVSERLMKRATKKISIPKFSSGADSLNAAVATAIICSEFRRS